MTRSSEGKSIGIIFLFPANLDSNPLKAVMVNGLTLRPTDGFIKIAGVPVTVERVY